MASHLIKNAGFGVVSGFGYCVCLSTQIIYIYTQWLWSKHTIYIYVCIFMYIFFLFFKTYQILQWAGALRCWHSVNPFMGNLYLLMAIGDSLKVAGMVFFCSQGSALPIPEPGSYCMLKMKSHTGPMSHANCGWRICHGTSPCFIASSSIKAQFSIANDQLTGWNQQLAGSLVRLRPWWWHFFLGGGRAPWGFSGIF